MLVAEQARKVFGGLLGARCEKCLDLAWKSRGEALTERAPHGLRPAGVRGGF